MPHAVSLATGPHRLTLLGRPPGDLIIPWAPDPGAHANAFDALLVAVLARELPDGGTLAEIEARVRVWLGLVDRRRVPRRLDALLRRGVVARRGRHRWIVQDDTLARWTIAARAGEATWLRFLADAAGRGLSPLALAVIALRATRSEAHSDQNGEARPGWIDSLDVMASALGSERHSIADAEREIVAAGLLETGAPAVSERWRSILPGIGSLGRSPVVRRSESVQNPPQPTVIREDACSDGQGRSRSTGAGAGDDPMSGVALRAIPAATSPVPGFPIQVQGAELAAVARLLEAHGVFARSPARREALARNVIASVPAADFALAVRRALDSYSVRNVGAYVARMAEGDVRARTHWILADRHAAALEDHDADHGYTHAHHVALALGSRDELLEAPASAWPHPLQLHPLEALARIVDALRDRPRDVCDRLAAAHRAGWTLAELALHTLPGVRPRDLARFVNVGAARADSIGMVDALRAEREAWQSDHPEPQRAAHVLRDLVTANVGTATTAPIARPARALG